MARWALKSLLLSPMGFVLNVLSICSAFLLVIVFEAVYAGETRQIVAYVSQADADIWVMQEGVANMHMATSYIPSDKLQNVTSVEGVVSAEGILYFNTVVAVSEHRWFAYLVGLDGNSALAKPREITEGKSLPDSGEVVVPAVLARLAGLGLGDFIRIVNREFEVVGLSVDTFSMANSVLFMARRDLEDMMSAFDLLSFILVQRKPEFPIPEVIAQITKATDGLSVLSADQFVSNDRALAAQMGVQTIALMTMIGGGLAALLVAFTIYCEISRQRKELAATKALGATAIQLYWGVLIQAFAISASALVLAAGLSIALMPIITASIPIVQLDLTVEALVRVCVLGITVAILAAWVPARTVIRLDPVSAF